jgi:CBS domain-containing protein
MEAVLQIFSRSLSPEAIEQVRERAVRSSAKDMMTTELITAEADTPIEVMARQMLRYDIDHILVVSDQVPLGIVARRDFLRMIAGEAGGK